MATLNVEDVDLSLLSRAIDERKTSALRGAVMGRTQMRDLAAEYLGCSRQNRSWTP